LINNDFMLKGQTSKVLYNIAKDAPIYDYHCHLSPKEIYEDRVFSNISKIFLGFDHYKWRAMRIAGIPEKYITGDAEDFDKFKTWARVCERLIGSPLYHWTNMELKMFFGIDEILKESNAETIYNKCNKKIQDENLSPVKLIQNSNVKLICTTDDPTDDLEYHKILSTKVNLGFKVLPTFRPDKAINILKEGFIDYMNQLSQCCSIEVDSYSSLITVLKQRIEYFHEVGCRLSDHSIESLAYYPVNKTDVEEIFKKKLNGHIISIEEAEKFKCHTLTVLAYEYNMRGWVMQLHIGAMRNTNEIMFKRLGVDTGFDIMNDFHIAPHLSKLLNEMNNSLGLPKTVLYNLNPKDNMVLSSLPHCFCEDGISGKLQFGAPWWFNDNKEGMYEHLKTIANQGMLAYFIGMLTDSRSFLSYARHDYFRRILCSFIGDLVDNGEFENDYEILKEIVQGICFKNIENYLALE
jgi:glucuronate isomerase